TEDLAKKFLQNLGRGAGVSAAGLNRSLAGGTPALHARELWALLHATGTPRFDGIEIACLRRFFGGSLPWITAVKRTTGHALGASGMIEAVLAVEGFRRGEVPCWPSNTDPALALDAARPSNPPRPEAALLIGQGMGGTVVVNLLARR
ncbi:MAG: hypothetical protein ACKOLA_11945, partial [Spartobacteria bacterium]